MAIQPAIHVTAGKWVAVGKKELRGNGKKMLVRNRWRCC